MPNAPRADEIDALATQWNSDRYALYGFARAYGRLPTTRQEIGAYIQVLQGIATQYKVPYEIIATYDSTTGYVYPQSESNLNEYMIAIGALTRNGTPTKYLPPAGYGYPDVTGSSPPAGGGNGTPPGGNGAGGFDLSSLLQPPTVYYVGGALLALVVLGGGGKRRLF